VRRKGVTEKKFEHAKKEGEGDEFGEGLLQDEGAQASP